MARSNEPVVWAPFFAGAGMAAMFMPITIFVTAIAVGSGWISRSQLSHLLENPLTRIYLFILISLSLFHAVHRIRYILMDFGLKSAKDVIAPVCYGTALVGTILAAILAIRM